nr:integrase, catalytic region, zinc finger, CCHC-type, peptidase aspartic, catalytic [Tanacetum cinerariifolium]
VKSSTRTSGSQPSGNTKIAKIQRPPSSTQKNKVEAHPRIVKTSLKNKNRTVEPKGTTFVHHSMLNANSKLICVKYNGYMLSDNHDLCVLNVVTTRVKSKSVKKNSKQKVWKPTGKLFINIRYTWRPTGRTFTIVGNACPLTRITTTTEVPSRKPIPIETDTPKPVVTLVYSRKPRISKSIDPVSQSKVIKTVPSNTKELSKSWGSTVFNVPSSFLDKCRLSKLFFGYLDSGCSKYMTGDHSQLTNFVYKFLGTVKFENDHVTKIMGYGDYQIGNVTISRVYYIEGLGHNLFSVGQFSRQGLVWGLPKLKFEKDHLCSACAMGKSKKKPHKPKSEDTNQEKLYLLHMNLCAPMHVSSINGKNSGPVLHEMTPATISSGLVLNPPPSTLFVPPSRTYWDMLFQPLFDELLTPPPSVDHPAPEAIPLVIEVVALEPAASTG